MGLKDGIKRKIGFKPTDMDDLTAEIPLDDGKELIEYRSSIAKQYHSRFKFNITHLNEENSRFTQNRLSSAIHNPDPMKTPDHPWEHYIYRRQTEEELSLLNWGWARGLGTAIGFNKLRVIDVDNCAFSDEIKDITDETIKRFLMRLGLPSNYEWVIESGSKKGFHILFYAEDYNELFNSKIYKSSNQESIPYNHIAFGSSFAYHENTAKDIINRRKHIDNVIKDKGEYQLTNALENMKNKGTKFDWEKENDVGDKIIFQKISEEKINSDLKRMYKLDWLQNEVFANAYGKEYLNNKRYFYGSDEAEGIKLGGVDEVILTEDKCVLGFERLELIWEGHLVLPPSMHNSNNDYSFINIEKGEMPRSKPQYIDLKNIQNLIDKECIPKSITTSLTNPTRIDGNINY